MIYKSSRRRVVVLSALVVGALVLGGTTAASAEDPGQTPPARTEPRSGEVVRVTLKLPHSLALTDAIKASSELTETVVAYAFEADNITGEYAPASLPAEEFLRYFGEDYGTQPQVTAFIVERSTDDKSKTPTQELTSVGRELPVFEAPPVVLGGGPLARKQAAEVAVAAIAADQDTAARPAPEWRPDYTAQAAVARGSAAYIGGYFAFLNAGLWNLPIGVGMEFEVNQNNPSVFAPVNQRPLCLDIEYKNRFWAGNYSYSWAAVDSYYGTAAVGGAYADYNDAEDDCQNQSIAIGLRYPGLLGVAPPFDEQAVDISIYAPRGFESSSAISGNIQTISDEWCTAFPLMTYTDCMGVAPISDLWGGYPSGDYNAMTLNPSRGYTAPGRCWTTTNGVFAPLTPCS